MTYNPYPSIYVPQQHIDFTTGIVYHYLALRKKAPAPMAMPTLQDHDHLQTPPNLTRDLKREGDHLSSSQSKRQRSLPKFASPLNEEEESDCPLDEEEEEESVSSSLAVVCHLNEKEDSDCSSSTASAPVEKEYHSGGSTTSSLSEDNATGWADRCPEQELVPVPRWPASREPDARPFKSSSLPLPLPLQRKTTKSGSLRYDKRLFSVGTVPPPSTADHQSASGGPVPAPQQQLPDHYVLTGCVDSPQEHRRRKAAREYNARRYWAKKLAIAELKSAESESAAIRAIVLGKLPACQAASPIGKPSATHKRKKAVSTSTLQRDLPRNIVPKFKPMAVPLPSTMSPLPLPKITKVKPPADPLPSNMSPLNLPPKARKFQPMVVPLPSSMSPLLLPPKVRKVKPTVVLTLPRIMIPLFVPPKLKKIDL
jgi:hypothetical protein